MAPRFLLTVAFLFFISLQGRSQNDLIDPLGSAFRIDAQAKIRKQLPPKTCAILFSGGFLARDPEGLFPQDFSCDPDFYYLTGLRLPDAAVVIFAEPRAMTEGSVSTVLFLPDKTDYGLVSMGYEYRGKFGLQDGGIAIRQAGQWRKFCNEILANESVERIFTKPVQLATYKKPGASDYWDMSYRMFAALAPGFAFDPAAQKYYKEILKADSATMGPIATRINARLEYEASDLHDPILMRFAKITRPDALVRLQEEIRRVKIDLLQYDCCLKSGSAFWEAAELTLLRKAAGVVVEAMKASASRASAGNAETKLQAAAVYVARYRNASLPIPVVIASGKHSAQPNYIANASNLPKSGPVVLDLAVNLDGFLARATRTVPAGGSFGADFKALYEGVLAIHQKSIAACVAKAVPSKVQTAGSVAFDALDKSLIFSTNALGARKVLKIIDLVESGRALAEGIPQRTLEVGQVICLETAIYLPDEDNVTAKWRGMGIVLRDMIYVGADGPEVLTKALPTDAATLESLALAPIRLPED
jgi:Xaa-Pro aminopeptidase